MPTFHRLEVFDTVAKLGNITRAARELHVSQPAISYEIKLLEQELGVKLLKRKPTGVELTDSSSDLLNAVKNFLSQLQKFPKKDRQ